MDNISTGEFFRNTYQTYGIAECVMGSRDCSYDWKLLGTMAGVCLEYDPNEGRKEKQFSKDSQLRISVKTNDSDCTTGNWQIFIFPSVHGWGPGSRFSRNRVTGVTARIFAGLIGAYQLEPEVFNGNSLELPGKFPVELGKT